jgi:molybdopterin synthase catalytic subunit
MILLTDQPIDVDAVLARVRCPAAGAVVAFLGTVRDETGGTRVVSMEYECYREMAEKQLDRLAAEARDRWPLAGCAIVHRVGQLQIGEIAVAVAVGAPHRREAFEAAEWLIDRIKEVVPIWKKEHYVEGQSRWIHGQT